MRTRTAALLIVIIALASLGLGAYLHPLLPAEIAGHWNDRGEVDNTIDKTVGVIALPILCAVIGLMLMAFPGFDPRDAKKSRASYDASVVIFILLIAVLNAVALFWNFAPGFPFGSLLTLIVGAFLILEASLMPGLKRNQYVGVLTPWSRSSAEVWDRIHRHAAKVYTAAGALTIVGAAFPGHALTAILLPTGAALLWLAAYSFMQSD